MEASRSRSAVPKNYWDRLENTITVPKVARGSRSQLDVPKRDLDRLDNDIAAREPARDSKARLNVPKRDWYRLDDNIAAPKPARSELRQSFRVSLGFDEEAIRELSEVRGATPVIFGSPDYIFNEFTDQVHRSKSVCLSESELAEAASRAGRRQDEEWDNNLANPQNWPARKKWAVVLVASWLSCITSLASTMVNPALPEIAKGLNVKSQQVTALIVSLDVFGFVVSGVLAAPLSEMYGRRILYTLSTYCFAALTLGCGFAPNIAVLLTLRTIVGALGSACMVLGAATCADVFDPKQRAQAMALWSSMLILGPMIGPIIGGIVVQVKGWRWVFYIFAIAGAANVALCVLLMPETAAVVLKRRGIAKTKADIETADQGLSTVASLRALARPLKLLCFSPVVLIVAMYSAITHAVYYLLATSVSLTFSPKYHFSPRTTGLLYLASGLGTLFGALVGGHLSGRTAKKTISGGGTYTPEKRLDPTMVLPGTLSLIAGVLLYGWSVELHVHYMSALAGLLLFGFGLALTATCAQTYVPNNTDVGFFGNGATIVYSQYLTGFLLSPGQTQDEASPYKYGDRLAADQNVIVVSMNYRLNIFGYPGAAALDRRNLNPGLLDQCQAVEWTYNNINAFGGDPERMTLFGQSAGGASVDYYSYAYWQDPLVAGFIAQSGVAKDEGEYDASGSNFTCVASAVGCGDDTTDKDKLFKCMQTVDSTAIINTIRPNSPTTPTCKPAARGLCARIPTVYAQDNNEGASLIQYNEAGVNQTEANARTLSLATCPGAAASAARVAYGIPVWRTRYFGEWPNLNPLDWLGAYHSSDILMIFGTLDLRGPDTEEERKVSEDFRTAWATFAKDPAGNLVKYGWPAYKPDEKTLVELGVQGSTSATFDVGTAFDGPLC
ncbi:hypothetical protein TI39_contig4368g00003 [Zymoseptoria brevis]|uniref:Major facilitator superfamily (MFS) profile domain-containing protein n=1 Tax=Zymoseptoria brevis TaxID=1047168 RepID=A0A0F4G7A3_9PEZI|nr:hypothetical protein TI39_contig4368g00003 [Zymoseptoria brevis]